MLSLRRTTKNTNSAGMTLPEALIALVVLAVIVSAHGATLTVGMRGRDESSAQYEALSRLRTIAARVQTVANQEPDVENGLGIGALYSVYDGLVLDAEDDAVLPGEEITFEVYGDETSVPDEFGGPRDLNFDGDADDDSGTESNGIDLRIVPMRIELSYMVFGKTFVVEQYRLFTRTTN